MGNYLFICQLNGCIAAKQTQGLRIPRMKIREYFIFFSSFIHSFQIACQGHLNGLIYICFINFNNFVTWSFQGNWYLKEINVTSFAMEIFCHHRIFVWFQFRNRNRIAKNWCILKAAHLHANRKMDIIGRFSLKISINMPTNVQKYESFLTFLIRNHIVLLFLCLVICMFFCS